MTAKDNGGEVVRLSKYVSKDEAKRAAQLRNLRPQSAVKHGAYSADRLKSERQRVLGELQVSFPSVRRDRLELAAAQRARITLLQAYLDEVGIVRHRGRGEFYPAVALLQREETAYRVELAKIEDLAREASANGGPTLADVEAELLGAGDPEDGQS